MIQYRKRIHRLDTDAVVAARVRGDSGSAEDVVGAGGFAFQEGGGAEAVDEERGAAGAGGVREEVEHLQAAGVAEVGCVGVGREGEGGVRRVFGGEVGGEVPEATFGGGIVFVSVAGLRRVGRGEGREEGTGWREVP